MLLNDIVICALGPDGASYISFTDKNAKADFEAIFAEEWKAAVVSVSDEYLHYDEEDMETMFEENPNPMTVADTENGFIATFDAVFILDIWGSRAYLDEAINAIDVSLERIKALYPNIEYEGCMQYEYSDSHGGDVVKYEINANKVHPYVGRALQIAFTDDYFWDTLEDYLDEDEMKDVVNDLMQYKEYFLEDTEERLNQLVNQ